VFLARTDASCTKAFPFEGESSPKGVYLNESATGIEPLRRKLDSRNRRVSDLSAWA